MHVRFVVNILGTKNCTQSALKRKRKIIRRIVLP